jgi:hypothetical protein
MKKVIRLTESDLTRIVKRIIKEDKNSYYPDHDDILQIMKDKYGYGDLSYSLIEEFEETEQFLSVSSDEEYADKLNQFIDRFGENL